MNKASTVVGATCYKNKKKISDSVDFTLPEITFQTIEVQGLGTIEIPLPELTDNLTCELNDKGVNSNFADYIDPGVNEYELRWVENVVATNGTVTHKGAKAFIKGFSVNIPSLGVKQGEVSERTHTLNVSRYQLYISGKEVLLIDKLAGTLKINGKDYTSDISKLL